MDFFLILIMKCVCDISLFDINNSITIILFTSYIYTGQCTYLITWKDFGKISIVSFYEKTKAIASDLPMIVPDSITGNACSANRTLWFRLDCFDNVSVFYRELHPERIRGSIFLFTFSILNLHILRFTDQEVEFFRWFSSVCFGYKTETHCPPLIPPSMWFPRVCRNYVLN